MNCFLRYTVTHNKPLISPKMCHKILQIGHQIKILGLKIYFDEEVALERGNPIIKLCILTKLGTTSSMHSRLVYIDLLHF